MPPKQPAEVVLRGGTVHTMVEGAEPAQAVALHGDRIVAVGSDEAIDAHIGESTEVIDLEGNVVIPGLIENHGHFLGMGEMLRQLDLTRTTTWEEIVDLVAATARDAEPGTWILGRGWHQEKWSETPADAHKGFPVHTDLSLATPRNPVILTHASGHAALVNAAAMELAGIDAGASAVEGGEVALGPDGEPTGLLVESAATLAWRAWNKETERSAGDLGDLVAAAASEAAHHGITTFVDAGTKVETLTTMAPLFADGQQPVRLWAMIRDANQNIATGDLPPASPWFRIGGIKVSLDGALGSRGAWLLESYSDAPDETGFQLVSLESLTDTALIARKRDLQLAVHAIGDRANRELLDLYERAFEGYRRRSTALAGRARAALAPRRHRAIC